MFNLHLDLSPILRVSELITSEELQKHMQDAGNSIAAETNAHIIEEVQRKLHSSRETYLDSLGFHQVDSKTWIVDLTPGAMFIEEGLQPGFDMLPGLLDDSPRPWAKEPRSGKTKIAKDGSRYRVIPMEQSKAPTRSTQAQQDLTNTIKSELKRIGAPGLSTIEKGPNGIPKLGLVRSLDIMHKPTKIKNGVGMGHGPIGAVRQGPTGIPFLQGVRIYQQEKKNKQGGKSVQKTAMTFRVASSKHSGERWIHPGLEARNFFEEAYEWAKNEWESKIGPELLQKLNGQF